jgi:gas vesicle protein
VNQTLRDLSKETQDSIRNYQESLQEVVKRQLNSIDDSIKETHSVVNKTIQNVGAEFEKAIKNQSESMNKTISIAGDSFKTVIQETAKDFAVMAGTIAESINIQEKTLTNVSQDVKVAIDKTLRELTEQSKASAKEYETSLHNIIMSQFNSVKDSVNTASKDFNRLLAENTEKSTSALMQQTQLLDKALQEELKKAIETMGKHLATLSNQFVKDYSPLTERLKEVVKIAEDLKKGR